MEKNAIGSGKVPDSLTLGTISTAGTELRAGGRRGAIPVIYFRKEGNVVTGNKILGNAANLEEALVVARQQESFLEADNLPKE